MTRSSPSRSGPLGPGDNLLAALSHELRTPLNGVLGMARLLARTRLDAAQRAYVAALEESGEHLLGLVNQVLDLARIEAAELVLHPAPMDVERLLQGVAEIMSPRAHAKGLEIAWASSPGLPKVMADEARLRQVLFNLAGNAVKFTDAGGALITAEQVSGASNAGSVRVRFTVRDTGPGVSAEDRQRIFEPFAQGPRAAAGAVESTGLGLAIVRRLADAMEAELGLDDAPGGGSRFWAEAEFPAAGAREPGQALGGAPVVIVASSPIVAEAAALQVRACGGEPLTYATAAAAAAAPPEAVALVDFSVCAKRRPQPLPGRRSIVLLGPEMRARIPAMRRSGFDGYLIKPLRRQSLARRLLAVSAGLARPTGAPPEDERARLSAGGGARVLLAEDNPINALLARALLEREGCVVDRACSGPEAVEAASGGAYDLILLDLRMPGMGGIEAVRAIRRRGVTTPVAALTAEAFEDARRACLEAGMDDFLTKPLEPAALQALLGRLVGPGFTDRPQDAKLAS